MLDLVFSTNPNLVSRIELVPGMSDHLAVLNTLDVRSKQYSSKHSHTVFKYNSANFEDLRADMAAYAAMFIMGNPTYTTTEEKWKSLKSAIHQAIIKHVPTTTSKTKRNLPWITRNKSEIRKRDRQYRKARKSKQDVWSAYRIKRQHLQKLMRSGHDDSTRNVIEVSLLDTVNQKKCWSFVKLNRTYTL